MANGEVNRTGDHSVKHAENRLPVEESLSDEKRVSPLSLMQTEETGCSKSSVGILGGLPVLYLA